MNNKNKKNLDLNNDELKNQEEQMALDDDQRIKILSPTALVVKRFIRNKLAITGLAFIIAMFLFSYVGGWIMNGAFGYSEKTKFYREDPQMKLYAGVGENVEPRFIVKDGMEVPPIARADSIAAFNKEEWIYESSGGVYLITPIDEETYYLSSGKEVAELFTIGLLAEVEWLDESLDDGFVTAATDALKLFQTEFDYNDRHYVFVKEGKNAYFVFDFTMAAISTKNVYDFVEQGVENTFDFAVLSENAIQEINGAGSAEFTYDDTVYTVSVSESGEEYMISVDNQLYSVVSRYLVQPLFEDIFLTVEFKETAKEAAINGQDEFYALNENGVETRFEIRRETYQWTVFRQDGQVVLDTYSGPSKAHLLGTDGYGFDLLTRLMYGGRISLIIGFIVVTIELIIGVILGGISGYFGGFIDNLIMRLVDVFNCIPWLPLLIILGTTMDAMQVDPQDRMVVLMLVLGILGWPGIARMVRGQILSLREQEFMIAAEATGMSVRKRIFKHLVPNVMPQLIVICTLALGGIIITESTLSFLGLGVKYPFASWGNIITAVSNSYVMTNYWFVWIPAGMLILITVLGFNFIGDGLRDAFDPKMKR